MTTRKPVRSIILSDDVLLKIVSMPKVKQRFPSLKRSAGKIKIGGCRCGAAKRRNKQAGILSGMREHVAGLSMTMMTELKKIVKVDEMIVFLPPFKRGGKPRRLSL